MQDGLYTLTAIQSETGLKATGVVNLTCGSLIGGDNYFYWRGLYHEFGDTIFALVSFRRHSPGSCPTGSGVVYLHGANTSGGASLRGTVQPDNGSAFNITMEVIPAP